MNTLYTKTNYLDKNIEFLFGRRITEYDMKSAGFNICREFQLLPEDKLEKISEMDKHVRHVAIGKLCKEDKELSRKLRDGFAEIRRRFFEANQVEENEVLSIKNDAIFILDRRVDQLEFGKVEFVPKHSYNAFLHLNKFEFYFTDESVDCKGINDKKLEDHREYMLDLFVQYCNMMKHGDKESVFRFIEEAAHAYRTYELDDGYYRELNQESLFRPKGKIKFINSYMGFRDFGMDKKYIDTSYNYTKYLIPLFQILL